jgi:hypothetical protein
MATAPPFHANPFLVNPIMPPTSRPGATGKKFRDVTIVPRQSDHAANVAAGGRLLATAAAVATIVPCQSEHVANVVAWGGLARRKVQG